MTHFDDIAALAIDDYGLITAARARAMGITDVELNRWTASGKLERLGRGVYRLALYVPTPLDKFATACAIVGTGSFIFGDSVLDMHGLAFVNPRAVTVATPKRLRRNLPPWIKAVPAEGFIPTRYEGIPTQKLSDAILWCRGLVMDERLIQGTEEAFGKGLITKAERDFLIERMVHSHAGETEQQE